MQSGILLEKYKKLLKNSLNYSFKYRL